MGRSEEERDEGVPRMCSRERTCKWFDSQRESQKLVQVWTWLSMGLENLGGPERRS